MHSRTKTQIKIRRTRRVRAKILGTATRPRLSVLRSNRFTSVQLIDDGKGVTLAYASSKEIKEKKPKTEKAMLVGELLAKRAGEKHIKTAVFDRRSYRYHGRIKALADGARKGGLQF